MVRRPFFRRHPRPAPEPKPRHRRRRATALLILLALAGFLLTGMLYLKRISSQIAVSDACDIMTMEVNAAITQVLEEGDYDADWFVRFEKNEAGRFRSAPPLSSQTVTVRCILIRLTDHTVPHTHSRHASQAAANRLPALRPTGSQPRR